MAIATRFLHTLYCDDVRNELEGKNTLVGIYGSDMNVTPSPNGMPVALAKLCVAVTAQTPKEQPFRKLKFKLLKDDEVIQELEVPSDALNGIAAQTEQTEKKFHTFKALFIAQPFPIENSFVLRVQAETESEELMASGLKVNLLPPPGVPTIQ